MHRASFLCLVAVLGACVPDTGAGERDVGEGEGDVGEGEGDPGEGEGDVGEGEGEALTVVARVKSVNGVDGVGVPTIQPVDDVVLEAVVSGSATDGLAYRWQLLEVAPGSHVALSNVDGPETSFTFDGRRGVDVAGPFEACVTATDNGESRGAAGCVRFDAKPSNGLLVQLTWAGDGTATPDLHLTKRGDVDYCVDVDPDVGVDAPFSVCAANDCASFNCGSDDPVIEWDGVAGRSAGDPLASGSSNAAIAVGVVGEGSYGFGVAVPTGVTPFVRLFIFGQLRGEWVFAPNDGFVEVGLVYVGADATVCVEDLTDGDAVEECPGFAP